MNEHLDKSKSELMAELVLAQQRIMELEAAASEPPSSTTTKPVYQSIWYHQQIEQTLYDAFQFWQNLFDTIPTPVFYQEVDGLFLGCNQVFASQILGEPAHKIIGREMADFPARIASEAIQLYQEQRVKLFEEPGIRVFEIPVACADGIKRVFSLSMARLFNKANHVVGLLGIMLDVTDHKQIKERFLQRSMELALLNRTSQEFISTLDLDQVLSNVLEETRQLLDVTGCSVWLVDRERNDIVCGHATDPEGGTVRGWRLAMGQGVAGWVALHGERLIVADTRHDHRHFKQVDQRIGLEVRSILSVPLKIKSADEPQKTDTIGVLQVVDIEPQRFDEVELRLLEPLAANAAIAIQNARFYKQAQRDAQTKTMLLQEVNHRVKNNLASIIGLLYAERRHTGMENQAVFQSIMNNLIARVQGLATVHNLLSASAWTPLSLSKLAKKIINSALRVVPRTQQVSVQVSNSTVRINAKQANSLALVINELATNTIKHVLTEQNQAQIMVSIVLENDLVQLEFRDNGPGYPTEIVNDLKLHNVGFYLIKTIVQNELNGKVVFFNDQGAVTSIQFKIMNE